VVLFQEANHAHVVVERDLVRHGEFAERRCP
jgi:hypothetical protein